MIARAEGKARRAKADVAFRAAAVEALPLEDDRVDAVLSTLMMHHLPAPAREQCRNEVRRVVRPGGRLLVADFAEPDRAHKGLLSHFHRHGHVKAETLSELVQRSGFAIVASGPVGVGDPFYVLARVRAGG